MNLRATLGRVGLALAVTSLAASCVAAPRMCVSESECGPQASCVAGRCVAHGATPAIASARRLLFAPTQVGWVRRGGQAPSGDVAVLGRGDGAVLFLRFDVALAPEANVLEAYLLLDRAPGLDADPAWISLHAARVASAWDPASLTWAQQPAVVELGAPVTRVAPAGGALVRVDVREIVKRWRQRRADELGVAVLGEGEGTLGLPVALRPMDAPEGSEDPVFASRPAAVSAPPSPFEARPVPPGTVGDPRGQVPGPRLELYVH